MHDEERDTLARMLRELAPRADALRKATIFDAEEVLILRDIIARELGRREFGRFIKATEWWLKYLGFLIVSGIAAKVWLIDWVRGIK